jgi:electron transfer flavoprotein alpha subunit
VIAQRPQTAAARVAGVSKVLVADNAAYAHQLAENMSAADRRARSRLRPVLAAATTNGKNVMPRVAALLDVAQISEITPYSHADTFQRPIYAGNVIATVQSTDARKVITVRTTGFDAHLPRVAAQASSRYRS